nr:hypothetical protein [Tanacetum cinerariifolium]
RGDELVFDSIVDDIWKTFFDKDVPKCSKREVQDVRETDFSKVVATDVIDAGKVRNVNVSECSKEKVQDVVDVPGKASDDDSPLLVSDDSISSIYEPNSVNKKKKLSKQISSSKASTQKPSSSKPSCSSDDDNPLSVSNDSDSYIYEPKSANKKKKPSTKRGYKKVSMTGCVLFIRALMHQYKKLLTKEV